MVGVDPEEKNRIPKSAHAVAGAVSGFATSHECSVACRAITQPIDVCKIRFQLQIEPIHKNHRTAKYHGILQAFRLIVREEGVAALWKGTVAGQVLSVIYGTVEFGSFEILHRLTWNLGWSTNPKDPMTYLMCGGVAGMTATIAAQPLDVLRTRFASQGTHKVYSSIYQSVHTIYHQEGFRGFYRGLVPAIIQSAPSAGLSFAFYAYSQRIYRQMSGTRITAAKSDSLESLICGALAGMAAKTVVYPLDVVKKRLQIQGFEAGRKGFGRFLHLNNFRASIVETYRIEGLHGFSKGYSPSLLKAAVSTGLSFLFYEQSLRILTA